VFRRCWPIAVPAERHSRTGPEAPMLSLSTLSGRPRKETHSGFGATKSSTAGLLMLMRRGNASLGCAGGLPRLRFAGSPAGSRDRRCEGRIRGPRDVPTIGGDGRAFWCDRICGHEGCQLTSTGCGMDPLIERVRGGRCSRGRRRTLASQRRIRAGRGREGGNAPRKTEERRRSPRSHRSGRRND